MLFVALCLLSVHGVDEELLDLVVVALFYVRLRARVRACAAERGTRPDWVACLMDGLLV